MFALFVLIFVCKGIAWVDEDDESYLIAVSDQMDSNEQNYRCKAKDQSMHVFLREIQS